MPTTTEKGRRRPAILGVASALLAVVGVLALVVGVRGHLGDEGGPPVPPPAANATATAADEGDRKRPGARAQPAGADLEYSRPVRIRIPSIDVDSSLVDLGLDPEGVMETPQEVEKAGWFRPSPPPGIPGATVIAGHVTWDRKPVVFFELGSLEPGDRVNVLREDGVTAVFKVTRIGSFAKDAFPTADVYDSPEGSELRLITCGGEYDEATRRYLDNVIVWAKLVDLRR